MLLNQRLIAAALLLLCGSSATATTRNLRAQPQHERLLQSTCGLDKPRQVKSSFDSYVTNAQSCADTIGTLASVTSKAKTYYTLRTKLARTAKSVSKSVGVVDSIITKFKPYLNAIPKVGPVVKNIGKTLDKVRKIVDTLGNNADEMQTMQYRFGNASTALKLAKAVPQVAAVEGAVVASTLGSAINASEAHSCCSSTPIKSYANAVNLNSLNAMSDAYRVCGGDFIDFDLNLDFPDFDLGVLEKINDILNTISDWIDKVLGTIVDGADYVKCCDPVISVFADIFEGITDVFNLATCWVDGAADGVVTETFDVLMPLLGDIIDEINGIVDQHNRFVNKINSYALKVKLPKFTKTPIINFSVDSCKFKASAPSIAFTTTRLGTNFTTLPLLTKYEYNADGSFDPADIGDAIAQACTDAWNSLTTSATGDCCPTARIKIGIPANGWSDLHSCNYDNDCSSTQCVFGACSSGENGSQCDGVGQGSCDDGLQCLALKQECTDGNIGSACTIGNDCHSGACSLDGSCIPKKKNGESCNALEQCEDGVACLAGTQRCTDHNTGSLCTASWDCNSGACVDGKCVNKRANGESCGPGAPCQDGLGCLAGTQQCTDHNTGSLCTVGWDCNSGACESGRCVDRSKNGEGCWAGKPCADNLSCLAFQQKCTDHRTGSLCIIDGDCDSDNYCSGGTCQRRKRGGEECSGLFQGNCQGGLQCNIQWDFTTKCG